ncbi:MAG: hypothetical protein B6D55_07445 [Candidatus Omnitrophica bacterium 4484_70.2]|nr:MAG: hypothetical protein B6D55_07445 [Candidatus Omnitrophica bacterium 4484_70.2]
MEVKLERLIEKIKEEGVTKGRKISQELIEKSKQEAKEIVNQAKQEAERIVNQAKQEATQLKKNAEMTIRQVSRDVVLALKEQLIHLCDNIFKQEVSKILTPDFLKELIIKIVTNWWERENVPLEILVSKEDKQKLEELLFVQLKQKAKNEIIVRINENVRKGFRIGVQGEDVYYDFSEESIWEALKSLLSPTLLRILEEKSG